MTNLIAQAKGLPAAIKNNKFTGAQVVMLCVAIALVITIVLIRYGDKALLRS